MIAEEILPMRDLLPDTLPRKPQILLALGDLLRAQRGTAPLLLLDIINRHKHLLHTPHVGGEVFLETARHEGAGGIAAGEEVVVAAGAVDEWVGGDVEDGAVDGEVDGEGRVGAVVGGELVGGEEEGALLYYHQVVS